MDILSKMFKSHNAAAAASAAGGGADKDKDSTAKDQFRKPQWFEESETDDELFDDDRKFAFQIFTNPMELQKHFERQMQQVLEAISEMEDGSVKIDKNLKEEYLKPGFESEILKEFARQRDGTAIDTDLDGEIIADELHSLMQNLGTGEELPNILPSNENKGKRMLLPKKQKLTDEETIMGKIHGTLVDADDRPRMPRPRADQMAPMTPHGLPRKGMHGAGSFGGIFEGTYQGPKMFSQSVLSKTVRKPDGSYETTKITQDSKGNKTTTVTRTKEGKSETITTYDGAAGVGTIKQNDELGGAVEMQNYNDRNLYVTKEGYALPRNLW